MKAGRDFVAYNLVAAASAASDWIAFITLHALGAGHLPAQAAARVAGGLVSFTLNKKALEDGHGHLLVQGRRFLLLYAFSMALSVTLLYLLVDRMHMRVVAGKLLADGTCFLVNFAAMRGYVFRATEGLTRRLRRAAAGHRWVA